MKYIYEGKTTKGNSTENDEDKKRTTRSTNFNGEDDEDVVDEDKKAEELMKGSKNKFKNQVKTRRPLIFICNDAFSKGLKELRRKAIVYNFKKPDTNKLMKRLLEICKKEVFWNE